MFKKILQSLSKSQAAKQPAPPAQPPAHVAATPPHDRVVPRAPLPTAPQPVPVQTGGSSVSAASAGTASPESLCDISPKMPKDQIQARLKLLYRRYNRSASSLDAKTRDEAEIMLDAIVKVREKHFGEI